MTTEGSTVDLMSDSRLEYYMPQETIDCYKMPYRFLIRGDWLDTAINGMIVRSSSRSAYPTRYPYRVGNGHGGASGFCLSRDCKIQVTSF